MVKWWLDTTIKKALFLTHMNLTFFPVIVIVKLPSIGNNM